ncbi:MAG: Dabb family protein [Bacteroidales bacterium]|nr:Dabb family protein [Bacteroidales bacterium]
MIKHVLLFKLREMETPEEKNKVVKTIKQRLEALKNVVPSLVKIEVGLNENPLESFDIALITEHNDWQGLYDYRDHPEHVEVSKYIKANVSQRCCADFEF